MTLLLGINFLIVGYDIFVLKGNVWGAVLALIGGILVLSGQEAASPSRGSTYNPAPPTKPPSGKAPPPPGG